MRVLVTGAAGFIGSTTAEHLLDLGHDVVALDDLSHGQRSNVPSRATFVEGDCGDAELVRGLGPLDACVHFAALIEPSESMAAPERFFDVNVGSTMRLLRALVETGVDRVVFSSSCAVYGDRVEGEIDEDQPVAPHSPYGESKATVERALHWLAARGRMRVAALRYFNAAGSTPDHPEDHRPETHLIPLALSVAAGRRSHLDLYGEDYPTRDGTCVRDYVHVADLADAHARALGALVEHEELVVNLGTGTGSSNREVVEAVRRVTGRPVGLRPAPRRPGDPAAAVASNSRAREVLGWSPTHSDLDRIVADAWSNFVGR
jgi:UDP-glucose 4-epimerase